MATTKKAVAFFTSTVFTLEEAAEILRISAPTIRRIIKAGEIDSPLVGGQRRITDVELRRVLHLDDRQAAPQKKKYQSKGKD